MPGLTIDEYLLCVANEVWESWEPATWPGDVFAVATAVIFRSSGYSGIGSKCWNDRGDSWEEEAADQAKRWRESFRDEESEGEAPSMVVDAWRVLAENGSLEIERVSENREVCDALITMCAICDETFEGVGVLPFAKLKEVKGEGEFWNRCYEYLQSIESIDMHFGSDGLNEEQSRQDDVDYRAGATLCNLIDPSRLRVLPKSQTPSSGLSVRSLTHYVSLCPQMNLKTSWKWHLSVTHLGEKLGEHYCNVLIIPWPFDVSPTQFSAARREPDSSPAMKNVGWFDYAPPQHEWHLADKVRNYIKKAREDVGHVHAIVMPEAALTTAQHIVIRQVCLEEDIILITGVVHSSQDNLKHNCVEVSFPDYMQPGQQFDFNQKKHHRWKLDEGQISTYSISGFLDPDKQWWENIPIAKRSLTVFSIREWLCTCPLICEDLARLDPVGQFVRTLAPDLVVALLFDGPQLSTRWSSRYATVLADDPGSSVLTVTSLGMTKMSCPIDLPEHELRHVIALWKDKTGATVEITLPQEKKTALLVLRRKSTSTATADGRRRNVNSGAPVLGGIRYY